MDFLNQQSLKASFCEPWNKQSLKKGICVKPVFLILAVIILVLVILTYYSQVVDNLNFRKRDLPSSLVPMQSVVNNLTKQDHYRGADPGDSSSIPAG